MAAYFQLISLATGQATPFNQIDEELCVAFNQPVDEDKYLCNWYNSIGQRVATGMTLDQVRTAFIGHTVDCISRGYSNQVHGYNCLVAILNWLTQHYTTTSWTSR